MNKKILLDEILNNSNQYKLIDGCLIELISRYSGKRIYVNLTAVDEDSLMTEEEVEKMRYVLKKIEGEIEWKQK